jgi:hypothetical protein
LSNCTIRSASIICFHFRKIAEVKRWREQEGTRRLACSQDPFSKVFAREIWYSTKTTKKDDRSLWNRTTPYYQLNNRKKRVQKTMAS